MELRDKQIVADYLGGSYSAKIAIEHGLTARQVQRIVRKAGASRTQSESYRLAIKQGRMTYRRLTPQQREDYKRLRLDTITRYSVLERDNFLCVLCGSNVRLEIDHIDMDAKNNATINLRTLCYLCNHGRRRAKRVTNKKIA